MNNQTKGFTLIELIISLVILALFVQLAIPSYQQWIEKAQRQSLMAWILQAEMQLEICYLTNQSYQSCSAVLPPLSDEVKTFELHVEDENYNLIVYANKSNAACYAWASDQTHQWKVYSSSGEVVSNICLK